MWRIHMHISVARHVDCILCLNGDTLSCLMLDEKGIRAVWAHAGFERHEPQTGRGVTAGSPVWRILFRAAHSECVTDLRGLYNASAESEAQIHKGMPQ